MPTTTIVSRNDGPRMTVATMMKSPTLIPKRIINQLTDGFLVDVVLRSGSDTVSGVVLYFETSPLFANDAPAIMDDFSGFPSRAARWVRPRWSAPSGVRSVSGSARP